MQTGFHIVGWGVAVNDKVKGSIILKVHPKELLPNAHGKVTEAVNVETLDSVDVKGNHASSKISTATYIECRWLDIFGHTPLPPDIRLGERVLIWRQGDSQTHFWTPSNLDLNKRLLEEVVIMASDTNQKDRKPKTLSYENTYSFKLDTYEKYIRLRTSRNDREKFLYEFLIDAKNEYISLKDDVGNYIKIDSKNTIITLINKDKTKYELNKKDINVYCDGNYHHTTKGDYTLNVGGSQSVTVGGDYTREVSGSISVKSGGDYTLESGGDYSQKSPSVAVETSTFDITSPASSFSGDVAVTGAVSCASLAAGGGGGSGGGAACKVTGAMECKGDMDISGKLTVGDFESKGGIKWGGTADGPEVPSWVKDT